MATSRQRKQEILERIQNAMTSMKSAVFFSYHGLSVHELEELRSMLRKSDAQVIASKRTLLSRAVSEKGIKDFSMDMLQGEIASVFGAGDEIAPATIIRDFAKKHEALKIQGGMLVTDGNVEVMNADRILALASLPSRLELLAKAVGSMRAPLSGLMNVLSGNLTGLFNVLKAIQTSKS